MVFVVHFSVLSVSVWYVVSLSFFVLLFSSVLVVVGYTLLQLVGFTSCLQRVFFPEWNYFSHQLCTLYVTGCTCVWVAPTVRFFPSKSLWCYFIWIIVIKREDVKLLLLIHKKNQLREKSEKMILISVPITISWRLIFILEPLCFGRIILRSSQIFLHHDWPFLLLLRHVHNRINSCGVPVSILHVHIAISDSVLRPCQSLMLAKISSTWDVSFHRVSTDLHQQTNCLDRFQCCCQKSYIRIMTQESSHGVHAFPRTPAVLCNQLLPGPVRNW